jgi:hypothetical protein
LGDSPTDESAKVEPVHIEASVSARVTAGASSGPWYPTMREAVLARAEADGLPSDGVFVDRIPDGFGPPEDSRRPAISDGSTFCVMYGAEYYRPKGWRLTERDGLACDPFTTNGGESE